VGHPGDSLVFARSDVRQLNQGLLLANSNGDAAFIAKALGDIARAKGMAQVAKDAGLSRESLYKALSGERSPDFDTILKVVGALGLKLHAEAPRGRLRASTSRPSSRTTKRRAA
jgi:probable addiction module antidote protein